MIRFKVEQNPISMTVERVAVVGEGAYERGYEAGYEKGNADGYTKGHTEGVEQGYSDGYGKGYETGHEVGLAAREYETWTITYVDGTTEEKKVALV